MKQRTLSLGLLTLTLAVGMCTFTPTVRARSESPPQSAQQAPDQQKGHTFVGQIVKAQNGQYALLVDKENGSGFYLDDQEKAKQFEGRNVKVIGTLDVAKNTIRVSDIQPA